MLIPQLNSSKDMQTLTLKQKDLQGCHKRNYYEGGKIIQNKEIMEKNNLF
jgi:hypothetical protein